MSDADRLNDMTGLLAAITKTMYMCGMPDGAMDGLFAAHDAVVDELVLVAGCKDAKERAIDVLVAKNEDGSWSQKIARIQGSIELDLSLAA